MVGLYIMILISMGEVKRLRAIARRFHFLFR